MRRAAVGLRPLIVSASRRIVVPTSGVASTLKHQLFACGKPSVPRLAAQLRSSSRSLSTFDGPVSRVDPPNAEVDRMMQRVLVLSKRMHDGDSSAREDMKGVVKEMVALADKTDHPALLTQLAQIYSVGSHGLPQSDSTAHELFQRVIRKYPTTEFAFVCRTALLVRRFTGQGGLPREPRKALHELQDLAERGEPQCMTAMAKAYDSGVSDAKGVVVPKDPEKAEELRDRYKNYGRQFLDEIVGPNATPEGEEEAKVEPEMSEAGGDGMPKADGPSVEKPSKSLAEDDTEAHQLDRRVDEINRLMERANTGDNAAAEKLKVEAAGLKRQAEETGHPAALLLLGNLYGSGAGGLATDPSKAVQAWQRVANEWPDTPFSDRARTHLAMYRVMGVSGQAPDPDGGMQELLDLADSGVDDAAAALSTAYQLGIPDGKGGYIVPRDIEKAKQVLQALAERGSVMAAQLWRNMKTEPVVDAVETSDNESGAENKAATLGEQPTVWTEYEKGAAAGDAAAMHGLGYALLTGMGAKKDVKRALELLKQAEAKGNAKSSELLIDYWLRMVDPPNEAKAAKHLQVLAKNGDTGAMADLGILLVRGDAGLKQDFKQGLELLHRAAEMNEFGALVDLGRLHHEGLGVPEDDDKAVQYWQRATQFEDASPPTRLTARVLLAEAKLWGQGIPQDSEGALAELRKLMEQGDLDAMHVLVARAPEEEAVQVCAKAEAKGIPTPELERLKTLLAQRRGK